MGGGSGWGGIRMDGNGEVKLVRKFKKKIFFEGGGGGRVGLGGVRVDVNGEVKLL